MGAACPVGTLGRHVVAAWPPVGACGKGEARSRACRQLGRGGSLRCTGCSNCNPGKYPYEHVIGTLYLAVLPYINTNVAILNRIPWNITTLTLGFFGT